MILYFTADLMSTSRVQGPANAQGIALKVIGSQKGLLESIDEATTALIVDLNPPARDAISTIEQAKAKRPDLRVLVHGPHVQVDLLAQAKQAGADVLTNGQFHQQVGSILAQLAAE
ncbi:hypothetical protein [Blastopirellula marina]|uniref:Uncharacterized protein n=1 Tax=Blastopirellula marina TaxID=124 RepID=A0A2S8G1E0_9BACT|nr:hypothetical protein [Blastopirellula marina]PQO38258.1 hypothetical protein C5Y98_09325 [Blastopirellula marina]PTL44914.1 hypothetical protein C5Y97_09330 [Blastopirellula marina]